MVKQYKIGRDPENQIVYGCPEISRFHADLIVNQFDSGVKIMLIDHSTNGTFVNGQKLCNSSCYVAYGDDIVLPGNVFFDWGLLEKSNYQIPSMNTVICTSNSAVHQENNFRSDPRNLSGINGIDDDLAFIDALKKFFNHYVDFSGRSRRRELWYMILWQIIILSGLFLVSLPFFAGSLLMGLVVLYGLVSLYSVATFIPSLALSIRRIHDLGQSGWFYLFVLIPIVGFVFSCIWLFKDSEYKTNQWGPCPKKIY